MAASDVGDRVIPVERASSLLAGSVSGELASRAVFARWRISDLCGKAGRCDWLVGTH